MKEYKKKVTSCYKKRECDRYYKINNFYHGYYYYNALYKNNKIIVKGFFNMYLEYSHWLKYNWKNEYYGFKYYL